MPHGIGGKIKNARASAGISQVELAKRVGLTQGHISKIEKGLIAIQPDIAEKFAQALSIDVTDLVDTGESFFPESEFQRIDNLYAQTDYEGIYEYIEGIHRKYSVIPTMSAMRLGLWSARALCGMGKYRRAKELLKHWQPVIEENKERDPMSVFVMHELYGYAYSESGDYQPAIAHLKQAYAMMPQISGEYSKYKPGVLAYMVQLMAFQGQEPDEYMLSLLDECDAMITPQMHSYFGREADSEFSKATLYFMREDYKPAEKHTRRALQMYKRLGQITRQAGCLGNLGFLYRTLGDEDKAIKYYSKCLKIVRENKETVSPDLVYSLRDEGFDI